jgi:hypothetical protein
MCGIEKCRVVSHCIYMILMNIKIRFKCSLQDTVLDDTGVGDCCMLIMQYTCIFSNLKMVTFNLFSRDCLQNWRYERCRSRGQLTA